MNLEFMPLLRLSGLILLAMIAFAGNSLLCRLALKQTNIDPFTFTSVRLMAGAVVLALLVSVSKKTLAQRDRSESGKSLLQMAGSWPSALALLTYALCFSLAYVSLPTASGALILFGAVQTSMLLFGLWRGERLSLQQGCGLLLACGGLVWLLSPGLATPAWLDALLMLVAGCAWGVYSIRGKSAGAPLAVTAGNFIRAAPLSLLFSLGLALVLHWPVRVDLAGLLYAIVSGAIASGLGYALWYRVLPSLAASTAASVQLSVPVIAALGGIVFLQENLSLRLILTSVAILGGIALVIVGQSASRSSH